MGIVSLMTLTFIQHLWTFVQTPYVTGWDGYFYLIQAKAIIEEGSMHSSDSSLIYPLLVVLVQVFGDYILTFKVLTALIVSLIVGVSYQLGAEISQKKEIGLLLAVWFVFSPHLTYVAAQFPKNILGFLFFLLTILILSRFLRAASRQNILLLIAIVILNYFGHRMTFVLNVGLVSSVLILKWVNWKLLVGILGILIALSFLQGLNWTDIERFDGAFTNEPHFSLWSFYKSFSSLNLLSLSWKLELLFSLVFLSFGIYTVLSQFNNLLKKRISISKFNPLSLGLLLLSVGLLFPFFEWSLVGFSYRFVLIFILLAPVFLAFLKMEWNGKLLQLISLLLIGVSFVSMKSYNPPKHDPQYPKYAEATEQVLEILPKDSMELLIAHNALAEYFTFTTGIDALPWQPEYPIDKNKLWRIATDIRRTHLAYYLSEKQQMLVHRISQRYYLIREDIWQILLQQIQKEGDRVLYEELRTWRNPHQIRPQFLLKKK